MLLWDDPLGGDTPRQPRYSSTVRYKCLFLHQARNEPDTGPLSTSCHPHRTSEMKMPNVKKVPLLTLTLLLTLTQYECPQVVANAAC